MEMRVKRWCWLRCFCWDFLVFCLVVVFLAPPPPLPPAAIALSVRVCGGFGVRLLR